MDPKEHQIRVQKKKKKMESKMLERTEAAKTFEIDKNMYPPYDIANIFIFSSIKLCKHHDITIPKLYGKTYYAKYIIS